MENKLQQLTQKLYDEGLEKGRADADKLVSEARAEAQKIVAEANARAEEIVRKAQAKAEDVEKNTMTEISLAGKQAVSKIKSEIASLIVAKSTSEGVKSAVVDPAFVKEMLVSVAKNWNGADSGKVELQALLPETERAKFDAAFAKSAKALLDAVWSLLETLPPAEKIPSDEFAFEEEDTWQFEIFRDENGAYVVTGGLVDLLCRNVVLNNPDSMAYFQRMLKTRGVFKALAGLGCKEGDTVVVGEVEFEYV